MKFVLISLILLILNVSCVTEYACEKKFGFSKETTRNIIYKDTIIVTEKAIVSDTISLRDTIVFNNTTYETRTILDTTGRIQLKWFRDSYNNLIAQCMALPDTIRIEKVTTTIKETPKIQVNSSLPKNLLILIWVSLGLSIIAIITFIVIYIIKK